ncbi:MAG TPA: GntR family transcriptional regulator, partial [Holophaga sp.]|nr:GntR family transcriptional regulator [Holophaga sp.]
MTIWVPDLSKSSQPTYIGIADAIADAVRLGQLRPGDALPTHRLLADLMGVNVSTITRAYREAAKRRLVGGETGRGTFVLGVASEAALFALQHRPEGGVIDLSLNMPPAAARDTDLAKALGQLDPVQAARYLHYPAPGEVLVHRQAAAGWLRRRGVEADCEAIVVCAGSQHAMDTAIGLFPEEEELACEALVYPGLKAAARHWRRRLHPLSMDREGLRPEAFEAACRAGLRLAVVSPTLHNPTTATMGMARRLRI